MSIERTQNELFKRLKQDILFRWHTETRIGNDGSAGNTLEDLLGIEENNLKIPDWGDIELKTRKKDSQSLKPLRFLSLSTIIFCFHKNVIRFASIQSAVIYLPAISSPLSLGKLSGNFKNT